MWTLISKMKTNNRVVKPHHQHLRVLTTTMADSSDNYDDGNSPPRIPNPAVADSQDDLSEDDSSEEDVLDDED